jgi:septum formation protein
MIVLASASPRRQEILAAAGIPFCVRISGVEERREPGEKPADYAMRLAQHKAEAVPAEPGEIVLGADTVVVVDDEVLEKPGDSQDAARMLRLLSSREHEVITGVCLRSTSRTVVDSEVTRVFFTPLSESDIAEYVATTEPLDKAGAYAIQGRASKFIYRVEGCYFNVVGLPIAMVYRHLRNLCASR